MREAMPPKRQPRPPSQMPREFVVAYSIAPQTAFKHRTSKHSDSIQTSIHPSSTQACAHMRRLSNCYITDDDGDADGDGASGARLADPHNETSSSWASQPPYWSYCSARSVQPNKQTLLFTYCIDMMIHESMNRFIF